MRSAAAAAIRRHAVSPVLVGAIVFAWAVAVVAQATGNSELVHHDTLVEGDLPVGVALGIFLLAWQLMIAAMMLPSSLPLMRAFKLVAGKGPRPGRASLALYGGYAAVWSLFGAAALLLDVWIHRLVESWAWLEANPQLIAGSVLILAGAFQFSDLKERCLRQCRNPQAFLMQHYGRGTVKAFHLGRAHGLHCLGCCWALMLVMFAAGVATLWWMAALTAVMVYEKTGKGGRRAVPVVGVTLLALAALVLAHPAGVPEIVAGPR